MTSGARHSQLATTRLSNLDILPPYREDLGQLELDLANFSQSNISPEQAQWFLSLPSKIRKQHFGRDEELALLSRSHKALEGLYACLYQEEVRRGSTASHFGHSKSVKCKRQSNTSVRSTSALRTDLRTSRLPPKHTETTSARIESLTTNEQSTDRKGHAHPAEASSAAARRPSRNTDRKSVRRKPALVALRLPAPKLSELPPLPPSLSLTFLDLDDANELPCRQSGAIRSRPLIVTAECQSEYPDAASGRLTGYEHDEKAVHFNDASSSHVVEEAHIIPGETVELPDDDDNGEAPNAEQCVAEKGFASNASFLQPEESQKLPSFDSGIGMSPLHSLRANSIAEDRMKTDRLLHSEGTMRLRLTRRDDTPSINSHQAKTSSFEVAQVDPLELEELEFCDDPSGAQGAFAVRPLKSGRRRKLWRALGRRR